MKFNSQICTTKEQSQRLLELGLKPETADMVYTNPAWSLHRLLVMLYPREDIYPIMPTSAYDDIICEIEIQIQCGTFNKQYLKGGAE